MKKITFVLNMPSFRIVGGYKMVYIYADYLAEQGYEVSIVYNAMNGENSKHIPKVLVYLVRKALGKYGPPWYKLDKKIKKYVVKDIKDDACPDGDVVFATAVGTAKKVLELSPRKGDKFYFVQDFENWRISDEEVICTYAYPMKKIVVSQWLKLKVETATTMKVAYVPNGIDGTIFKTFINYADRKPHTIAMLYHKDYRKGCDIALSVISKLKKRYTDLEVFMFGSPEKENWPEWIHYKRNASPEEVAFVMNQARVFLSTSRIEGFGLTGLESMFCGCLLVSTRNLGVLEYATQSNAFLCETNTEDDIFNNVCLAFENDNLSESKLSNANAVRRKFDINESKKKFRFAVENFTQD